MLVPKTTVIRKEEGATVDSSAILSPYLLSAGRASSLVRPDRQRSSMETFSVQQESPINYRKCPTNETKRETWNVKRETWNAGDFQSSDWLSKTDEYKYKMQNESEKAD